MRRTTVLSTLALAASTVVLTAPTASAVPPLDHVSHPAKAAKLICGTGLVLATEDRTVRYDVVDGAKVTASRTSKGKLGFDVTAWGFFDFIDGKKTVVEQANAVTPHGVRRVSMSFTGNKKIGLSSTKYAPQSNFKPVLYADANTYYAYITTRSGQLQRWTLTRYPGGAIRYADKQVVATGLDLTSLQATAVFTIKGAAKEVLYGTTGDGALLQIAVPIKKPTKEKVRTIAETGYAGVTEMSWSYCNRDLEYTSLIAVDPEAGTATWTTIKDSNSKPRPSSPAEVTGGDFKGIVALF